jgi:hypothetical protein
MSAQPAPEPPRGVLLLPPGVQFVRLLPPPAAQADDAAARLHRHRGWRERPAPTIIRDGVPAFLLDARL